jgi:rhomboid protease GluP
MGSYPPTPPSHEHEIVHGSPEVLPPGTGTFTSPPPVRRQRSSWAAAPATYFLVGINCLVYIAMALNHVSPVSPTSDQLMHWGANNAGSVLISGQWWRIVSAMFVHAGFLHLATNMWCLWNLGLLAEPLMGSAGVVAVYILTGAGGNVLSTGRAWFQFRQMWEAYHAAGGPDPSVVFPPGVGASGAVFGIAGALIVLLRSDRVARPTFGVEEAAQVGGLLCRAQPGARPSPSTPAHPTWAGGLKHRQLGPCGRIHLGPALRRSQWFPRSRFAPPTSSMRACSVAVGMLVGVLVLFGFYLSKLPG